MLPICDFRAILLCILAAFGLAEDYWCAACAPLPAETPMIITATPAVDSSPRVTVDVSAETVAVGETVTIRATVQSLGIPQYTLTLTEPNGATSEVTIRYYGEIARMEWPDDALFAFEEGTATMDTATFTLRAQRAGSAEMGVYASGEGRSPGGAFFWTAVESPRLTLQIR